MRKPDEGMNVGNRPVIFFYVSLALILLLFLVTRWHSFGNWVILLLAMASFLCTYFIGQELADGKEEGLVLVFLYTIVPCFTLTKYWEMDTHLFVYTLIIIIFIILKMTQLVKLQNFVWTFLFCCFICLLLLGLQFYMFGVRKFELSNFLPNLHSSWIGVTKHPSSYSGFSRTGFLYVYTWPYILCGMVIMVKRTYKSLKANVWDPVIFISILFFGCYAFLLLSESSGGEKFNACYSVFTLLIFLTVQKIGQRFKLGYPAVILLFLVQLWIL